MKRKCNMIGISSWEMGYVFKNNLAHQKWLEVQALQ